RCAEERTAFTFLHRYISVLIFREEDACLDVEPGVIRVFQVLECPCRVVGVIGVVERCDNNPVRCRRDCGAQQERGGSSYNCRDDAFHGFLLTMLQSRDQHHCRAPQRPYPTFIDARQADIEAIATGVMTRSLALLLLYRASPSSYSMLYLGRSPGGSPN